MSQRLMMQPSRSRRELVFVNFAKSNSPPKTKRLQSSSRISSKEWLRKSTRARLPSSSPVAESRDCFPSRQNCCQSTHRRWRNRVPSDGFPSMKKTWTASRALETGASSGHGGLIALAGGERRRFSARGARSPPRATRIDSSRRHPSGRFKERPAAANRGSFECRAAAATPDSCWLP